MGARDIVVVGGSAGAFRPLKSLVYALPESLGASLFIVVHTSADTPGRLPLVLEKSKLPVSYPRDGDEVFQGHVYVAPPDHHLLLDDGRIRVVHGPRENGFRPAIDPLFRTAARTYGPRVIGVILSGALDDGTNGLALVKRAGGLAVVQHPAEAEIDSMPLSAVRNVEVDHVVPADEMATLVVHHAGEPRGKETVPMPQRRSPRPDPAEGRAHGLHDGTLSGPPSAFVCPECNGALWELQDGTIPRFACHIGHSYSMQALLNGKAAQLEPILWSALRALEENAAVLRRAAERADQQRMDVIAAGYRAKAEDTERRANVLREALLDEPVTAPEIAGLEADAAPPAVPAERGRRKRRAR